MCGARMNLSQLKFVKSTAQLKSFSQAAKFCHVTQPTLSNGISKLEEQLGEKIFVRTTRKVGLTPFGEMLLPSITSLLNMEEMIYLKAKEFTIPETVVLKVGISPLVNTKFVTLLTSSYKTHNSNHEILLIEENLAVLDEKLEHSELDLIVVPIVRKLSTRNSLHLYEEDLFFIDDTENAPPTIPINDIRDKTFVMVPDSCGLSEITRSLLRTTRKEMTEYEGKALSYQVLADWASNGLGSAILPKSKIMPHIAKQKICKAKKPVQIAFQAKWLSTDNMPLRNLIQHFKNNVDEISRGLSD
jgi:DNA-binding transcriptional LysR family regulator